MHSTLQNKVLYGTNPRGEENIDKFDREETSIKRNIFFKIT